MKILTIVTFVAKKLTKTAKLDFDNKDNFEKLLKEPNSLEKHSVVVIHKILIIFLGDISQVLCWEISQVREKLAKSSVRC